MMEKHGIKLEKQCNYFVFHELDTHTDTHVHTIHKHTNTHVHIHSHKIIHTIDRTQTGRNIWTRLTYKYACVCVGGGFVFLFLL